MPGKTRMFYNALLLTGVNLLLRLVGTAFQVFISGKMGPAGVGLLHLVMSVGMLSMTAGMAGIRTATMYLTAEELGRRHPGMSPGSCGGPFYTACCAVAPWPWGCILPRPKSPRAGWEISVLRVPSGCMPSFFLWYACADV